MRTCRLLIAIGLVLASASVAAAACPAGLKALPKGTVDMSEVRAVAISPPAGITSGVLRFSGVEVNGNPYVMDVQWKKNGTPGRIVRGSITHSVATVISNLRATIVGEDTAACGTEFPDRVQLKFDYEDCNGDLLGGVAVAGTTATMTGGGGPIKGAAVWRFYGTPSSDLTDPKATSGTATLETCYAGVAHMDFSLHVVDADDNVSNTLTLGVDIP